MAVTIAPSVEASQAIVDAINDSSTYCLEVVAERMELAVDPLEEVTTLRVDVVHETEEQLEETLDVEDRTTHEIRIWVRKKVSTVTPDELDRLKLLVRQLFQRVNNFTSSSGRVKVWQCELEGKQVPDKGILNQAGLFVVPILLRVEVEPS
jgi:uncharacterized Ntn-hydrolase superfamily protein